MQKEKQDQNISVVDTNNIEQQVEISQEVRDRLSRQLLIDIQDADDAKSPLIGEILKYREILNIEPDSENEMSSFDGASNYRDELTATHCKVISSMVKRTLIANPVYLIDIPFNKQYEKWLNAAVNDYLEYTGITNKMRKLVDLAVEEGTSFAEVIDYTEEYDVITTEVYLKGDIEKFRAKYPDYKMLDLKNEKEYNDLLHEITEKIDKEGEARIKVKKKVIDRKVDIEVRSVDEMYIIPYNSANINSAKGIFSKIQKSKDELKEAGRIGFFDKDAVEYVIKNEHADSSSDTSSYRDVETERLGIDVSDKSYFVDIYAGIYICDIGNGNEEFYIYFAKNTKTILRIEQYPRCMIHRNIVAFSINPQHNQIFGISFVKLLENTQAIVDTTFNQMVDNNHIANVSMYRAGINDKSNLQSDLNSKYGAMKLSFEPGKVFFTEEPLTTLQTTPLNLQGLFNMINLIQRNAEVYTGATQGLSGRENPGDPSAPARKTELQLNQSTLRIDDYLRNLQQSFNTLGILLLYKLLNVMPRRWRMFSLQFAQENKISPDVVDTNLMVDQVALRPQDLFTQQDAMGNSQLLETYMFDDIVIYVRGQSLTFNKDVRLREAQYLMQMIGTHPAIQSNPDAMYWILKNFLSNFDTITTKDIDTLLKTLKSRPTNAQDLQNAAQMATPPPLPAAIESRARQLGMHIEEPI